MPGRERPPPAVLLYLLGRRNLLVWHSPDEFVALRPPDTTTPGDRRALRLAWLDRWWHMIVVWLPPCLALLLAVPCVFVPALLMPGLLLAMGALVYTVIVMTAPALYALLWLCRRLAGATPGRSEASRQLIQQNWSISGDESVPQVNTDPVDPVPFLGLFFLAVALILAYQSYFVADQERTACGTRCDGRPASYGEALYWLLGRMLVLGDTGGLSPATTGARMIGLTVTVLGFTVIGVLVAAVVHTARRNKKNSQDLGERVRQSLESATRAAMGSVFINYRQGDDDMTVANLYRTLSGCFGPEKIFMDIRSMPPGTRYPDELRDKLDASAALLAVIGQNWLTRLEQRRNSTGTDWVRFEISTAIRSGKKIIPVLLDDATLPTADQLPPELADLAHRQVCRLRWTSLDEDTTRLVATIESHLRRGSAQGDLASA